MANYRRAVVPGGTFFFTLVTYNRRPWLTSPAARRLLRKSFRVVRSDRPFAVDGIVLLPDHLHCIWTLPRGDSDFATRWRLIKGGFTRAWLAGGGAEEGVSVGRAVQGGRGVWQRRFYEHTIRDEEELRRCLDYVHLNPVKHGLCERAADWPWSSLHRYIALGEYEPDWGGAPDLFGDEWQKCE